MKKFFDKSEIWFAIVAIIIYTFGHSITDELSVDIGVTKLITLIFDIIYTLVIVYFIKKNKLAKYYKINKSEQNAKESLYYIPLLILAFHNIFFGVQMNMPILDSTIYICSMLFVGFLEEIIFRGFLFNAMKKDNIKSAIIVSSLTFGIGHIINYLNGSAELIPTLCQILFAVSVGYLFVILLLKGKSIIPCIITHSLINMTSVFANATFTSKYLIPISVVFTTFTLIYAIYLRRNLKVEE